MVSISRGNVQTKIQPLVFDLMHTKQFMFFEPVKLRHEKIGAISGRGGVES